MMMIVMVMMMVMVMVMVACRHRSEMCLALRALVITQTGPPDFRGT